MTQFFKKLDNFLPFFSEADVENLKTTCYMGHRSRSHCQPDEGRLVGSRFNIAFDETLVATVNADWEKAKKLADLTNLDLVLPSGTSLGWPFFVSDDGKGLRAIIVAMSALAVDAAKAKKASLSDSLAVLSSFYGPRYIYPGFRYQHSAKPMPVFFHGGFMWTQNVEFRTRLIAMVDKVSVIWNRPLAKRGIATALKMGQHNQSRPYIQSKMDKWLSMPNCSVVASDVSGYDNGLGGKNLSFILKQLHSLFGDGSVSHADLLTESSCPLIVPFQSGLYCTSTPILPQLGSGCSYTTLVGLWMGDYMCQLFGRLAGLTRGDAPSQWDYLNWGDDVVLRVPKSVDIEAVYKKMSQALNFEFDFEPTVKYLGFDYASGAIKTNNGYSLGRLLQKSVFPESPSPYPFSVIGYAARLSFVKGDAASFHSLYTKHFWDPVRLGVPFQYSDLRTVLDKALVDASNVARPESDALNFLLHGISPDDGPDLLQDLDFDFTKWIGRTYIDFSDPERVINDQHSDIKEVTLRFIPEIKKYGFSALATWMDTIAAYRGLRRLGVWS